MRIRWTLKKIDVGYAYVASNVPDLIILRDSEARPPLYTYILRFNGADKPFTVLEEAKEEAESMIEDAWRQKIKDTVREILEDIQVGKAALDTDPPYTVCTRERLADAILRLEKLCQKLESRIRA